MVGTEIKTPSQAGVKYSDYLRAEFLERTAL